MQGKSGQLFSRMERLSRRLSVRRTQLLVSRLTGHLAPSTRLRSVTNGSRESQPMRRHRQRSSRAIVWQVGPKRSDATGPENWPKIFR
jgi:hypothetical protein